MTESTQPAQNTAPWFSEWLAAREANPGHVILFQLGWFYYAFDADADAAGAVWGKEPRPAKGGPVRLVDVNFSEVYRLQDRLEAAGHQVTIIDRPAFGMNRPVDEEE